MSKAVFAVYNNKNNRIMEDIHMDPEGNIYEKTYDRWSGWVRIKIGNISDTERFTTKWSVEKERASK